MLCLLNNINNIRKILINIERNMRRISSLIINSSNFAARQKSINFELQKEKKDEQKSSAETAAGEQIVLHNEASSMGLGLVDLLEWGCCCWRCCWWWWSCCFSLTVAGVRLISFILSWST